MPAGNENVCGFRAVAATLVPPMSLLHQFCRSLNVSVNVWPPVLPPEPLVPVVLPLEPLAFVPPVLPESLPPAVVELDELLDEPAVVVPVDELLELDVVVEELLELDELVVVLDAVDPLPEPAVVVVDVLEPVVVAALVLPDELLLPDEPLHAANASEMPARMTNLLMDEPLENRPARSCQKCLAVAPSGHFPRWKLYRAWRR